MDIEEAYKVLEKYYSNNELKQLYRIEKFDNSETDTIRKHKYIARLLEKQAYKEKDIHEKQSLFDAAKVFRDLYNQEEKNR